MSEVRRLNKRNTCLFHSCIDTDNTVFDVFMFAQLRNDMKMIISYLFYLCDYESFVVWRPVQN